MDSMRSASEPGRQDGVAPTGSSSEISVTVPAVTLVGSFTVDPLVEPLSFLLQQSGLSLEVKVVAYGQIFQQLLDPTGLFARNSGGTNVVLLRFEDWLRERTEEPDWDRDRAVLTRNVDDLIVSVTRSASPNVALVLCLCPPSPAFAGRPGARELLAQLESRLSAGLEGVRNVHVLRAADWGELAADSVHDAEGDAIGHVPYQPLQFTTLAMGLARRIYALHRPPRKVLVLDCDNTLWGGVVGEDGVDGIEISPRHRALQEFVLAKKNQGMIVCLASKNVESDVLAVLDERKDMVLRRADIVSMRLNWLPKSENIRALAQELNLGVDSVVFLDDNPVESAEVAAGCPGALVINLPVQEDFPTFVSHLWPLDHLAISQEDKQRTEMYRQNLDRGRFRKSAASFADFLAGLELTIDLHEPRTDQLGRVAQLSQRTNQFNFTTRRRSEAEVAALAQEGKKCLCVEVKDRFGDYGLVGAVILEPTSEALIIESFMLSCRVLGRGVEHAMMREVARLAAEMGRDQIFADFAPSKKNLPARQFLDTLEAQAREQTASGVRYVLSASRLRELQQNVADEPADAVTEAAPSVTPAVPNDGGASCEESARWNRFAREFDTPAKVLAAVQRAHRHRREIDTPFVAPRTSVERKLAAIWADALNVSEVGVHDDFFASGGTSLDAVKICARIERELGKRFALVTLLECPTIEALAARCSDVGRDRSLVLLNAGKATAAPLFLVHDADGEILLYRNLAQRLAGDRAVYGLKPQGREDTPSVHVRIADMAAHYVQEIRKVRSHGPYLLGGLCAGGVIAFEMARQLEAMNEDARLVAVFDAAHVAATPQSHRTVSRRLGRLAEALVQTRSVSQLPRVLLSKAQSVARFEVQSRFRHEMDRIAVTTLRFCLQHELPLPGRFRDLPMRSIYVHAESEYRPSGALRREIGLFRATSGEGAEEPYVRRFVDPLLGWGRRTTAGVRAWDVPGGHSSMLQEPMVKVVAEALQQVLAGSDLEEAAPFPTAPGHSVVDNGLKAS